MTVQEDNRPLLRSVTIAAALVGLFQGILWFILSLLCILIYYDIYKVEDSTEITIQGVIYASFLTKGFNPNDIYDQTIIVTPEAFNIVVCFYLILSFIWCLVSSLLLWAMLRNKWQNTPKIIAGWSCTTTCISLLDVILMSLIASDYNNLVTMFESSAETQTALTAYGIVMSMAARGYILWIVNVIFTSILIKFALDLFKKGPRTPLPIIDAYATDSRPPWDMANSLYDETNATNFEFTNKAYEDDNGMPFSSRSQSFLKVDVDNNQNNRGLNPLGIYSSPQNQLPSNNVQNFNGGNQYQSPLVNNQYQSPLVNNQFIVAPEQLNQSRLQQAPTLPKIAKIGKQSQGRRTPPQNVPPPNIPYPYIPEPDYTPPGSPKIRSVLRPKSNYVL